MTTRPGDPAFQLVPDTISGTYIDASGVGRDITLVLHYPENGDSSIKETLTKKEYFASEILKHLITSEIFSTQTPEQKAQHAIIHADALISELNNIPLPD